MLARAGVLPVGENWAFEPKWDGARFLLRGDGRAELFSRNANNFSSSFPEAVEVAEAALAGHRVILDGEVVVLDEHALPSFDLLSRRLRVSRPPRTLSTRLKSTLVVFDVLHLDGRDLTARPYRERRGILEELLANDDAAGRLVLTPSWTGVDGADIFDVVANLGMEGVVAKSITSPYQPGRRSPWWVKTPIRHSGLFAIGGAIISHSRPDAVGSLLVGAYDHTGQFVYAGHITSGFTDRARHILYTKLCEIPRTTLPFANVAVDDHRPEVLLVEPVLVGRVEYRDFNRLLRHPAWKGLEPVDPSLAVLPLQMRNGTARSR